MSSAIMRGWDGAAHDWVHIRAEISGRRQSIFAGVSHPLPQVFLVEARDDGWEVDSSWRLHPTREVAGDPYPAGQIGLFLNLGDRPTIEVDYLRIDIAASVDASRKGAAVWADLKARR